MKKYHITFYKRRGVNPLLGAITISAADIMNALSLAMEDGVQLSTIKYIIEL